MTPKVVRSEPNGKTILVCGAGVGGLMTALECWRRGWDVRIIERSPGNVSTGDSFNIGNSALRNISHYPSMEQRAEELRYSPWFIMCDENGEPQAPPIEASSFLAHGMPITDEIKSWRYSRPQFHSMLLDQVAEIGLQVEYGNKVEEYFEDASRAKAGVVISNGSRLEADLVVAADGVRGASWSLVAGHPVPAESTGRALFRVAMPEEEALKIPGVAERWPKYEGDKPMLEMWTGPTFQAFFGRTPDRFEWFLGHIDHGTAAESWNNTVSVDEVLKITAQIPAWPEIGDRVIKSSKDGQLVDWKLMFRDPQPKWTSPAGLVIQLGDAAHTFLPSSGNGATQALEDATSLAACLEIAGTDKIAEATRVHNLLRFERVSFLQAFGVANQEVRERKTNPKLLSKTMGRWLVGHHPEKYAQENYEKARAHLLEGAPFKNTNRPTAVDYKPWTIKSLTEALAKGEPSIMDGDWST